MKKDKSLSKKQIHKKTTQLTATAILIAVIVVLQMIVAPLLGKVGFNFSLVLIPISLGAMLYGKKTGLLLGLIFGVATFISGLILLDPFTNILINNNAIVTLLICLVKGAFAGLVPAILYSLLKNKNDTVAIFIASASAPIVNTGLFCIGSLYFKNLFMNSEALNPNGVTSFFVLLFGIIAINFVGEFIINIVFAPSIRII